VDSVTPDGPHPIRRHVAIVRDARASAAGCASNREVLEFVR
jgi:hypothetical protein